MIMLQLAMIRVRVLRQGQADAEEKMWAPCTVDEALQTLEMTGRMQDSTGVIMNKTEGMQAGEYTLFITEPQGESQLDAL